MVLLLPNKCVEQTKKISKEIKENNETIIANREQYIASIEMEVKRQKQDNLKLILEKQMLMGKTLDFYSVINSVANDYLIYRLFQYHEMENLLIYGIPEKSDGSLSSLKSIAAKENVQFVLNFPEVITTVENGEKVMYITAQLYDATTNEIVFEKTDSGMDGNPGLEFTCEEGTLFCCINNALKPLLALTEKHLIARNPEKQAEKKIAEERLTVLKKSLEQRPNKAVTDMITKELPEIPIEGCFQGFTNSDKTRMIAFFVYDTQSEAFKKLDTKADRNIQIISDKMTFGNGLRYYSFIVTATLYEGKWYTLRKQAQRFDASDSNAAKLFYLNNCKDWHYFKEKSAEINPDFWSDYFFTRLDELKTTKPADITLPPVTLSNPDGELIHQIVEQSK